MNLVEIYEEKQKPGLLGTLNRLFGPSELPRPVLTFANGSQITGVAGGSGGSSMARGTFNSEYISHFTGVPITGIDTGSSDGFSEFTATAIGHYADELQPLLTADAIDYGTLIQSNISSGVVIAGTVLDRTSPQTINIPGTCTIYMDNGTTMTMNNIRIEIAQ